MFYCLKDTALSYANHGCKIVLLGRGLEKAFMNHACLDGRFWIILVGLRKRGKGFRSWAKCSLILSFHH